ncbi:hypothetical protein BDR05DRAFT_894570, partial [Suillus weaverae]
LDTLSASIADFLTIVFVIDIRDQCQHPISKLIEFIVAVCPVNPGINFEVFEHKVERLQEYDKIGTPVFPPDALMCLYCPSVFTDSSSRSQNTTSPKAFLFEIPSKLRATTDTSPVDQATHKLCCDYLSILNSFEPLYRYAHIT